VHFQVPLTRGVRVPARGSTTQVHQCANIDGFLPIPPPRAHVAAKAVRRVGVDPARQGTVAKRLAAAGLTRV